MNYENDVLIKRCRDCGLFCEIDGVLHCEDFDKPCADIDWFDCDYGAVTVEQGDTIVASFYNLQEYEDMELIAGRAISWFGQHFRALKDFCSFANISREAAMRIFKLEEDELD